MGCSLLLMVTLGVLSLLHGVHIASTHPLLMASFHHPSRDSDIDPQADEAIIEATQNDPVPLTLQGHIELAQHAGSMVHRKLSTDKLRRLHNLLHGSHGLAKNKAEWQKWMSNDEEGILAYNGSQAPTVDIEMLPDPSSNQISPMVPSKRGGAQQIEVSQIPANKRSAPLEYHMIPPEVVQYVLQGWRDHSARQQALEDALKHAGMKLPAGWRGRDDLSVGLDVEVLKVIIADMNRHLQKGHQRNTQTKLARLGKRAAEV